MVSREHERGSWTRALRAPEPRLAGICCRSLIGYRHGQLDFGAWLEPPTPSLTLMIDLEGSITADGRPLPDAWLGGLGDRPTVVGVGGSYGSIDIKLTPLGAYRLAGMPLAHLAHECVPVGDVFGPRADELVAQLRDTEDWDARFDAVERFLVGRLARAPLVDPAVAWTWERLAASRGRARIGALAAELGAGRRHLSQRFHEQIGLPPKLMANLLRFAEVRRRIEHDPAAWADLAYDAGYADQPHFNREFQRFAGTTPSDFVARLIPGGGVVGDRLAGRD